MKSGQLSRAIVYGREKNGREVTARTGSNPLIFAEDDYDTMMHGFNLDLANLPKTLRQSPIIVYLLKLISERPTWQLIENS